MRLTPLSPYVLAPLREALPPTEIPLGLRDCVRRRDETAHALRFIKMRCDELTAKHEEVTSQIDAIRADDSAAGRSAQNRDLGPLTELRRQIEQGLSRSEGTKWEPLEDYGPGLVKCRNLLLRASDECARLTAHLAKWQNDETHLVTHRYIGKRFRFEKPNGEYAKPGEVVPITAGQARAFFDAFEEISEEIVETVEVAESIAG